MNEIEYERTQENAALGDQCLANLEAILSDNSSDMTVKALYRTLYRYTNCGAWLSVQTHDGVWHHCNDLDDISNDSVRALQIGSIVEGSDAEVNADPIDLMEFDDPAEAVTAFNATLTWVDDEACGLWEEANEGN